VGKARGGTIASGFVKFGFPRRSDIPNSGSQVNCRDYARDIVVCQGFLLVLCSPVSQQLAEAVSTRLSAPRRESGNHSDWGDETRAQERM
jgi:hypothetical protein